MAAATLDVYVDVGCPGCEAARSFAAEIQSWFPRLVVVVRELGDERVEPPDWLVAVPAFVLQGRLIQYGRPERGEISEAVQHALASAGEDALR